MSLNKRRGFIDLPLEPPKRVRPLPPRLGGPSARRRDRQNSVLESDLFGIPLDIWEDRDVQDEEVPQTVLCPNVDEEDVAPIQEADTRHVLRPLTTNLLGVNIAECSDNDISDDEAEDHGGDKENKTRGPPVPDEVESDSGDKTEATLLILEKDGVTTAHEIEEEEIEQLQEEEGEGESYKPPIADAEFIYPMEEISPDEITADGPVASDTVVDNFHLALMIFTTTADISVKQYTALVEVLSLATISSIQALPKSLKTLRNRCRKSFPLSKIKARPVAVNSDSIPPKSENPRLAYYFEMSEYCKLWLSNPKLEKLIYRGMGEIVDEVSELWQGDAWMESVRSTSGHFATIQEVHPPPPGGLDPIIQPIVLLPSDCVMFKDNMGELTLGRVKCIGIDRRPNATHGSAASHTSNCTSAIVNRLVPPYLAPPEWLGPWKQFASQSKAELGLENYPIASSALNELIMIDSREVVPCSSIVQRVWVHFVDYSSVQDLRSSLLPKDPMYFVRAIAYMSGGKHLIRSVHKRHRVAAELELVELTRAYVLGNLVDYSLLHPDGQSTLSPVNPSASNPIALKRISLPFSTFLDGFGLYRNAYHSLKGMYVTPAGLEVREREKLFNLFVLMIGPFGASETEMAACLRSNSRVIGRGFSLELYSGESVFVTSFPLLFTGDMPQQNQNAGNKTHNAEFGCRSCLVADKDRGNLSLDIVATGRYKAPTQHFYQEAMGLKTKRARDAVLQSQGLTSTGPYFTECYTMLDPQRANPNDPMHAELRLAKYFEEAVLDGLLSPTGIAAYRQAWNDIEMPHGWGQPQNPVNHKGSMVFSEHGRVAMINPFVLMHMFTNDRWKHTCNLSPWKRAALRESYVKKGINSRLEQSFVEETRAGTNHKHQILQAAFGIATTINLTLKETLTHNDRTQFNRTVWGMRHTLRRIFACASGEKSFKNYANVPNIHLGLHYEQDIINFGTTRNCTTMMGEQKHKIFKVHAPHTNSKENDLQLLKMTNTSQTIRFMLDGTFQGETPEALMAQRVNMIVGQCPTLKGFVGVHDSSPPASEEQCEGVCAGIEDSQSSLYSSVVGKGVTLKSVTPLDRAFDYSSMVSLYKSEYGVVLAPGMRMRINYWGYFAGESRSLRNGGTKPRRFRVKVNGFIKLLGEPSKFYCIRRILTTTMGTMVRVFFLLEALERVLEEEIMVSPYPVLRRKDGCALCMVGIERVQPSILHFVSKGEGVWWFNPYVPYFI